MATENNKGSVTWKASADLSAAQFRFMETTATARTAQRAATAGGTVLRVIGVLQDKPAAAGRAASIMNDGISKVVSGGTVTAGSAVTTDSQGRAVNAGATDFVCGVALDGTTTAGVIVSVQLQGLN